MAVEPDLQAEARQQRWALARTLIERWWRPFEEGDQVTPESIAVAKARLSITLPVGLHECYALVGRRDDLVCDDIVPPEKLSFVGNVLVVSIETQAVVQWGIKRDELAHPDPRVLVDIGDLDSYRAGLGDEAAAALGPMIDHSIDEEGEEDEREDHSWFVASPALSRFLLDDILQACLNEAQFRGKGILTPETYSRLREGYEQLLPTRDGSVFPNLYQDRDTLLVLPDEDSLKLMIAARSREAINRLVALVGPQMEYLIHQGAWWGHEFHDDCQDVQPTYIDFRTRTRAGQNAHIPPCHDRRLIVQTFR